MFPKEFGVCPMCGGKVGLRKQKGHEFRLVCPKCNDHSNSFHGLWRDVLLKEPLNPHSKTIAKIRQLVCKKFDRSEFDSVAIEMLKTWLENSYGLTREQVHVVPLPRVLKLLTSAARQKLRKMDDIDVMRPNDPRNEWLYGQFCKIERGALAPQAVIVNRLRKKWGQNRCQVRTGVKVRTGVRSEQVSGTVFRFTGSGSEVRTGVRNRF